MNLEEAREKFDKEMRNAVSDGLTYIVLPLNVAQEIDKVLPQWQRTPPAEG